MKLKQKTLVGMSALAFVLLPFALRAETASVQADDFSVTDTSGTAIVVSGMGGRAITVMFDLVSDTAIPPLTTVQVYVGGSDPSNLFSGDFTERDLSGLRFRVTGDGTQPGKVELFLRALLPNGTSRTWSYPNIGISADAGDWTVTRIPLDPLQGWIRHYDGDMRTEEGFWQRDLQYVDAIYLAIDRNGNAEQSYSVADFSLVGEGADAITAPARLSLMEDYFGVSDIELVDRTIDSNGDGMSDYDALRAGLDPRDPSAIFAAAVQVAAGGNTVNWPGVLYGNYAIMRSTNLLQGFEVVGTKLAGFTGTQTWVDEKPVEGLPNFYKVVKY